MSDNSFPDDDFDITKVGLDRWRCSECNRSADDLSDTGAGLMTLDGEHGLCDFCRGTMEEEPVQGVLFGPESPCAGGGQ